VMAGIGCVRFYSSFSLSRIPRKSLLGFYRRMQSLCQKQNTSCVVMISPDFFALNEEATKTNAFINTNQTHNSEYLNNVHIEFNRLVECLRSNDVEVRVSPSPEGCPDAVFPNNWFSTHSTNDGTSIGVLYPMFCKSRQKERNETTIELTGIKTWIDFSRYEKDEIALEGTGAFVLDRENKIAYMCESPRANVNLALQWSRIFGFNIISFEAFDGNVAIYHTNVIMSIGKNVAIICDEVIPVSYHDRIFEQLSRGRSIVLITREQMRKFCGNALELIGKNGNRFWVMSETAYEALNPLQIQQITENGQVPIFPVNVSTIETYGGGSVRCMIAEIFN